MGQVFGDFVEGYLRIDDQATGKWDQYWRLIESGFDVLLSDESTAAFLQEYTDLTEEWVTQIRERLAP